MPHVQIEYSANLEETMDISGLCEAIRVTAAEIDAFPTPGIRVRAIRVDHVAMADGDLKHAFIDLSVRLREGRSADVKKDAIARIFATLKEFTGHAMLTRSIALSAELRDIDDALSLKSGNVRDYMEGTA